MLSMICLNNDRAMRHLQYNTLESVGQFLECLADMPTEVILNDPHLSSFVQGAAIQTANRIKIAEAVLYLMEQREVYEVCNNIIKTYPELQVSATSHL